MALAACLVFTFALPTRSSAQATAASADEALATPAQQTTQSRPPRVITRPKANADRTALAQLFASLQCTVRQTLPAMKGIIILDLAPTAEPLAVIEALQQSGLVEYAELDASARALMAPNDPYFVNGAQWPLKNLGTAGADIMAEHAWNVITDASSVIVAVVDSGIRFTHQDLAGNMWTNPGESGTDTQGRDKRTNGVDDDANGYVDDVFGINVLNRSGNPYDDWGHGSHVAGVVGAVGNNGTGIAGIAWRVKLMACKFIDANGNYSVSDAITALDYARQKGARIVTGAWGGYSFTSAALRDAIVALRDADIIFVAAAGNDGSNNDATPLYPASYEYSNVVAVAATDRNDSRASFSNYGAQTVDLGAPGADILSCWAGNDSDYQTPSGTSMASSHVAGACALLRARFPSDSHQQIINRVLSTVDPLPALSGRTVTGGRLNLAAALSVTAPPVITSATSATATAGTAFSYQIVATNSPKTYSASNLAGTGLSLNVTTGLISGTPSSAGTVTTQLTATNDGGASSPVTLTITVRPSGPVDTIAPTLQSFVVDLSSATATSASFVVTFSEPVTGLDASDFALSTQGTATAAVTGIIAETSSRYRVNFTFGGSSGSVQMAIKTSGTGIADLSSNPFAGVGFAASEPVPLLSSPANDTAAPTVSSFAAGQPSTSSVTFTLTFAEPVNGVSPDDFLVLPTSSVSASVGNPVASSNNTVFSIPVNFTGSGSLQLVVLGGANSNIRDSATNWFAGGTGQTSASVNVPGSGTTPSITSATSANATAGQPFSYQITASGSPTSFSATNLSGTGLTLNTTTGLISGSPQNSGTISTELRATNEFGTSSPRTLTINVQSAPVPVITSPSSASAVVGTAFSYRITATHSPTQYAATNLAGTGLSLNANTGLITGTPVATGIIQSQITATNSSGSSAPVTLAITVSSQPVSPPTVQAMIVNGTAGEPLSAIVSATNNPSSYGLTGQPSGISINASTGVISGTPAIAGTFQAIATATNSGGTGSATITFSIVAAPPPPPVLLDQVVTFTSPTSAIFVGQPFRLGATATSGLPITYTIVSGPGRIAGDMLTATAAGQIVVRATQAGDSTWAPASANATVVSQKAAQSISAGDVPRTVRADQQIALSATASSNLPVTYTLVSGPAVLNGTQLSFTGAAGTVVIRVSQPGNEAFNPASALDLVFTVVASGQQIYVGKAGADDLVVVIAENNTKGVLLTRLSAGSEALPGKFVISGGEFSFKAKASTADAPNASGATRTFSGTVRDGTVTGRIEETGTSFSASILSPTGTTTPLAGLYRAKMPGSSSGEMHLVVGPGGQAYGLVISPSSVASGMGSCTTSGAVAIPLSDGGSVTGTVDGAATVAGTVKSDKATLEFAGLSDLVTATDRLVNISSRLRVAGNDPNRAVIAGFVVVGDAPKPILIRAIGPGLTGFGISNPLAEPELQVYSSGGTRLASNKGWNNDPQIAAAGDRSGAFKLSAGSKDSAVLITLAPGAYTAQVSSTGSGIALVEVYDVDANVSVPTKHLVNISTRGHVGTGDDAVVCGFVVRGNEPKRVLARGIGPGLTQYNVAGILNDPVLKLYDAKGVVIAQNDNWGTPQPLNANQLAASSSEVTASNAAAGAFPLTSGSTDAVIVITLSPGSYTAIATGSGGSTGSALVEVYEIPNP